MSAKRCGFNETFARNAANECHSARMDRATSGGIPFAPGGAGAPRRTMSVRPGRTPMTLRPILVRLLVLGTLAAAAVAHADVTGSYDGGLTPKKSTEPVAASAVFTQADTAVSGTVALPPDLESFGGEYL